MSDIRWTPEQREAIRECGRSIVVSAAAGSGKTAVLAERCAYLVCDAPAKDRCPVDRLLVVTFTEAAAAEMKDRIRTNLAARLAAAPNSAYLREQVGLLETAQISTIHAFCLWLIRRWFNKAETDPAAAVLPEDEARILKADALDGVVARLYEGSDDAALRFRTLVDVYGLGRDDSVRRFTRRLADYLDTLPDADAWLNRTLRQLVDSDERLAHFVLDPLEDELLLHRDAAKRHAHLSESPYPLVCHYGNLLARYAAAFDTWHAELSALRTASRGGQLAGDALTSEFDALRARMADLDLKAVGGPRKKKDTTEEELALLESAKVAFKATRDLFNKRIRDRFASFTASETIDGLNATSAHVGALIELTRAFGDAYRQAKRQRDVIDFSDLEAIAYKLVGDDDIAATVRARFEHVLVDEYQDINPLQDALLRRVSREDLPGAKPNLFTVGDVKQSIYRFRAADPDVFRRRMTQCADGAERNRVILLRENFRSRPEILDAVNRLFEQLMHRSVGGIDYDDQHALRPGRPRSDDEVPLPVELHLLDRKIDAVDNDTPAYVDPNDPAEWQTVEREAYVIGTEIRRLIAEGVTTNDGRPITAGDVAILLRSPTHRGVSITQVLRRFGFNAVTQAGENLFDGLEVRDVRALLEVLDNTQQDIPLAAVLRSRVLGAPFSEDELLAIRSIDPDAAFCAAVRRYAAEGADPELRDQLSTVLARIHRYRRAMRERPFAEVLWEMLESSGYVAYVGGLSGGARRRANLIHLHERARQFGTFRQQGLRRFLRFVELLEAGDQGLAAPPPAVSAPDTVRIMSIHASKGLQFPVVFVADLGRRMNLGDKSGRMIFDRDAGIGLRVVDPERMIEYPSAAHNLAAAGIDRATRAEELRLLYVALTRAQEKLILVGSTNLDALASKRRTWSEESFSLTPLAVQAAMDALDWLAPAIDALPADLVHWRDQPGGAPLVRVRTHSAETMRNWRIDSPARRQITATDRAAAALEPLPPDEPVSDDRATAEAVADRVAFRYPHLTAAGVKSITAASEVKGVYDALRDPEEQLRGAHQQPHDQDQNRDCHGAVLHRDRAKRRGTATHLLLQHMDLSAAPGTDPVRTELDRLIAVGIIDAGDTVLIDTSQIDWFLDTPLGRAVREAGDAYRREFMFMAAHPACWFDDTFAVDTDERVLVRGVVDGILPRGEGVEIIDFKTDEVPSTETARRAERYQNQMKLYAASVAPIFGKPVLRCWLVFLHAREIVPVDPNQ